MRRLSLALLLLLALFAALAGRAAAQSPGASGCDKLLLRTNAAGSFDTLCLGDAGASYAISPDGHWAASSRLASGVAQVGIVDLRSQGAGVAMATPQPAPGADALIIEHLAFSPESARLAYAVETSSGTSIEIDTLPNSPFSSSVVPLPALESADGAPTNVEDLLWTPDGSALTAVLANFSPTHGGFAIVALDPSGAQPARFLLPYGQMCVYGASWSLDGQTLAFAAGGLQNPCGDASLDGIYTLDAASGATTRLTSDLAVHGTSWTSDGRLLAEVFNRSGEATERVALFGLDGSATYFSDPRPTACTETAGAAPPQEANGTLLYQADDGSVVLIDLTSGQAAAFNDGGPAAVHTPLLSPDGSQIAQVEQSGGGADSYQTVLRIDAIDGSPLVQQAFPGVTLTLDAWLPDGSGLLATAETGEQGLCPNDG